MDAATHPAKLVRFGVFEIDLDAGELRKQGRKLKLQEQPFQILLILLARRGGLVSRDELKQRLWPGHTFVDFDHSLNTGVMRLREVLGDSSESPRFIETVPKRGYRFIAPIDVIAAPNQDGLARMHIEELTTASGITAAASVPAVPGESP
jgi:DNA-binding winged helix-turn-helix (wHTH) protein